MHRRKVVSMSAVREEWVRLGGVGVTAVDGGSVYALTSRCINRVASVTYGNVLMLYAVCAGSVWMMPILT